MGNATTKLEITNATPWPATILFQVPENGHSKPHTPVAVSCPPGQVAHTELHRKVVGKLRAPTTVTYSNGVELKFLMPVAPENINKKMVLMQDKATSQWNGGFSEHFGNEGHHRDGVVDPSSSSSGSQAQPFVLPPPGTMIMVHSDITGKTLRIGPNGNVDANGHHGPFAKFIVSPNNGYLRLQSSKNPGKYLAIRKERIDTGPGGPACELAAIPVPGASDRLHLNHAHGHGSLHFDAAGHAQHPRTPYASPASGSFRYEICQ
eukprot:m.336037 g.336037  ORF g.336037 m.336037 type:complete len:263 (-) comp17739_c0_seq1:2051-2839(-)